MQVCLEGKRAFITDGGAGMGRATALAMHKLGAQVFTCDVDAQALSTLPDGIKTFVSDVSNPDAVDAMFDEILPGGLDILVNNAGIGGPTKSVEDVANDGVACLHECMYRLAVRARRAVPCRPSASRRAG
ncbi:SDR family NAD(P)-dependent oxidoreductase [Pseudomonas veronii]|uniref:SDR family NAD(P)-dependent oxidoreductase n=1 Tax=Pseudomonas veronii TaxID=76761 RepID=UPI0021C20FD0|nr:SDR family NAD(P)-dependent oxidoreductase [Pseudomonas veronii]